MSIKIYDKRGQKNYREKRLLQELQPVLDEKASKDPSFAQNFKAVSSEDELQKLHAQYCSTDVPFEEITKTDDPKPESPQPGEGSDDPTMDDDMSWAEDDSIGGIDPMNKEAPIVRDYVTNGDSLKEETFQPTGRTVFDEPVNFNQAFEMPEFNGTSDDDDDDDNSSKSNDREQKNGKSKQGQDKKGGSVNPEFDNMSAGKKKRSTKKFAKYIVETVCVLAEKGFVWFATSHISEAKIAEYEINGEIDTTLILSLDGEQEYTVKQFFQQQCLQAEQLSKIDPEEKADLAEALAEVLMEKGVAPTASQELILIGVKIFGTQALTMLTLRAQTNSVLAQLRAQNEQQNGGKYNNYSSPQPEPAPMQPQSTSEIEPDPENGYEEEELEEEEPVLVHEPVLDDTLDIERVEETKE